MIALTARLNERDETIIQLQEELDAYERIHRDSESLVDKKQERIMQLEQIMQQRGVEIPYDDDGGSIQFELHKNNSSSDQRKYPAYEQYHLSGNGEDDEVPLQLLTADEKIEELNAMLEHKDNEMQEIKMQLQNSIRPESLKERVEQIVQREVEERIKQWQLQNQGGDSGGSLEGGS